MAETKYAGVPVVPGDPEQKNDRPTIDMTPEQEKRAGFISKRLRLMEQAKTPHMQSKRRSLMMFDGRLNMNGDPSGPMTKDEIVAPIARIFVEAKTAREIRAFSDYVLAPVDDEDDAWRAELVMQTFDHVRKVTKSRPKRHELLRMKNIIGISIKWKGFRSLMVKMNVTKAVDENGVPTEWEEKDVPGDSDIFEEVIDPFCFYVDPNATSMNDALDCAMYFKMNAEEVAEVFGGPGYDIKGLKAGADGMVEGLMYFKRPSGRADMFCVYAWPSAGYGISGMKPGHVKEVFYGGLPDEHKMLPFVSYHNVPTFTTGFFEGIARSSSGEPATSSGSVSAKQKFWAYAGDPEIIMDLIDLRTSFGRSLYKACDLASRSIIATEGNARFDSSTDWQHGEQAVGMKGKFETATLGVANIGAFQFTLDDIYLLCIQATGIDPRNLTDTKQKTLGETISQKEESAERLQAGIDFNEEIAEIRDGIITHELIQQHYTKTKMVRLTGAETEKELEKFDEVEGEHPRTGKPLIGHRYRRIRSKYPMSETKAGKEKRLKKEDSGVYSFLARPEYIRMSEVDITVTTKRRASEIQALAAQQASESINMYAGLLPYAQPSPTGGEPVLTPEIKDKITAALEALIDKHLDSMNIKGKQRMKGGTEEKAKKLKDAVGKVKANMKPLAVVSPPEA